MSPLPFTFPPESYSAVYAGAGVTANANVSIGKRQAWRNPFTGVHLRRTDGWVRARRTAIWHACARLQGRDAVCRCIQLYINNSCATAD